MIKITPRFFVLPLIAIAVIASLPRSTAQTCTAPVTTGSVRVDTNSSVVCPATRQHVVMAATGVFVR